MRPSFADTERLKARAARNLRNNDERIRRWWCDKYKAPSTDPRFTCRSYAEWTIELLEDTIERRDILRQQVEAGEISATAGDEALRRLNEALGEEAEGFDPLVDQWERDLAEGRMPDLDL